MSGKNFLGDLLFMKFFYILVGGEVIFKVLFVEVVRFFLYVYEIYGYSGGSSNM